MASNMEKNEFVFVTPDLGDAEKIELIHWYKQIGDSVEVGEEVLELVTDKAAFPMESPKKGKLSQILKTSGSLVQKGESLGVLQID